ncbi:MAG: formate dehydrogenase [Burkholderiales bacterium]
MNASKPSTSRRKFLFALGAGSAGAAAVVITAGKAIPEVKTAEQKQAEQKATGYRLTEHNQHYYRTTRI